MASQGVVAANSRLAEMQAMYEDVKNGQAEEFMQIDTSVPTKLNGSWAGKCLLEALNHLPPNNFKPSLDMKFQKKQMLEREEKKLALFGDCSHNSKNQIGNGKVRQMFDDRRRGVGIDRSHPLRPIMASTTSTDVAASNTKKQLVNNKRLAGGGNVIGRPGLIITPAIKNTSVAHFKNNLSISNANTNIFQNNFDEVDTIDNETFPIEFSSLSLNSTHVMGSYVTNNIDFENNNNEESISLGGTNIINKKAGLKANGITLNPVVTKKSPTLTAVGRANGRSLSSSKASTESKSTIRTLKSPPTKAAPSPTSTKTNKAAASKAMTAKPGTFVLSVKQPPRISTPPPGMTLCQHCQRHFNEERLDKHEEVCRKMMSKKRKVFDASKHRVKGTEAETYLKTGRNVSTISKNLSTANSTVKAVKNTGEKKNNWRKKHEEFIAAIREAKKVQAHLAKGGKLSDLPPPPPSENPDYIQCPHCSRRFNESAAERHIPKCANMQHNKPKPIKKR